MRFGESMAALALVATVGGSAYAADPWIGLVLEKGVHGGAKVRETVEGSPGQKAGIAAGDEVLALDATHTDSPQTLVEAVRKAGIGSTVKVKIIDVKGHSRTLQLKLEPKPSMGDLQRNSLVGHAAPDFELAVQSGAKFPRLSTLKGQVVVIDFFATWCGPCVAMMPHIQEMHDRLGQKGLKVIGISTESAEIVAGAASQFGLKYSLASDGNEGVSASYRVYALPTIVVIDRQGIVREVAIADADAVDTAVAAALKTH